MSVTYTDAWQQRGTVNSAEPSRRPNRIVKVCEYCGKPYKNLGSLKKHVDSIHKLRYHTVWRPQ